jgi:peptidoglycan hydrolase CwlO-like protein
MYRLRKKPRFNLETVAVRATKFIGSTDSIIIHTILFVVAFVLYFFGITFDKILLVVTTIVSLEAIYLSIFIQMSVNYQANKLHAVAKDVDEIQEDVEDIQEDVDEIQKDVDEIQEDVEEIQEEDETEEKEVEKEDETLSRIEKTLGILISEIAELKKENKDKNI